MTDNETLGRELLARFDNSPAAQRMRQEAAAMDLRDPNALDYLRTRARSLGVIRSAAPAAPAKTDSKTATDKAIEEGLQKFRSYWHKATALGRAWNATDKAYLAKQSKGGKK